MTLLYFLHDYEELDKEEQKLEAFKQALIQAFPHQFPKIYKTGQDGGVPENFEQKAPETDEEFQELQSILEIFTKGQKTERFD